MTNDDPTGERYPASRDILADRPGTLRLSDALADGVSRFATGAVDDVLAVMT